MFMNTEVNKREKKKSAFRDGIVPLLIMFGVMGALMGLFYLVRDANPTAFLPVSNVAGEETEPGVGRCIYMIFALIAAVILTIRACALYRKDPARLLTVWTFGTAAGTLMWQSLGECLWHFGMYVPNEEGELFFANFPRLESVQGLPFAILLTMLVVGMIAKDEMNFGLGAFFVTFLGNWLGHVTMIGTYPIALALGSSLDMVTWYRLSGAVTAAVSLACGLPLLLSEKTDRETKYYSAALLFIAIGALIFGVILGET